MKNTRSTPAAAAVICTAKGAVLRENFGDVYCAPPSVDTKGVYGTDANGNPPPGFHVRASTDGKLALARNH